MEKNKGFTLVELLIVIAIIGILATVLITVINPAEQQRRARDASIQSDLTKIGGAGEGFAGSFGSYKYDTATSKPDFSAGTDTDSTCWNGWKAEGFARGDIPESPDGSTYRIECGVDTLEVCGCANGDTWHYTAVNAEPAEEACGIAGFSC